MKQLRLLRTTAAACGCCNGCIQLEAPEGPAGNGYCRWLQRWVNPVTGRVVKQRVEDRKVVNGAA